MNNNNDVIKRLDRIENNLEIILKELEEIKRSGKHMDSHINFVNNVYNTVRYPLNSIMRGFGKKSLPMIDLDNKTTTLETDIRKTE